MLYPYTNATGTRQAILNLKNIRNPEVVKTELEYRTRILKFDIRLGPVSCSSYRISCIAFDIRTPVGPDSARCIPPAAFCLQLSMSVSAGRCAGVLVLQRVGGTFTVNAPARHAPASRTTHGYLVLRTLCVLSLHRFGLHTLFCAVLRPLPFSNLTYIVLFLYLDVFDLHSRYQWSFS